MIVALWLGCAAPEGPPDVVDSDPPSAAPVGGTLALIADPHVTGEGEHADRLRAAVAWVNARDDVDGAVVLGDIAWSGGHAVARAALDALAVPWWQVTGDNEIQSGFELDAYDAFDDLDPALAAFVRAPAPVAIVRPEVDAWLQNAAFDLGDVRVVVLDWSQRLVHPLYGELGTPHDVPGGTLPFLVGELDAAAGDVVLLSHEPMFGFPGGFDAADWTTVTEATAPWADKVVATAAGHLHLDLDADAGPWPVHVVDATWDDALTVALLRVDGAGASSLERVEVAW